MIGYWTTYFVLDVRCGVHPLAFPMQLVAIYTSSSISRRAGALAYISQEAADKAIWFWDQQKGEYALLETSVNNGMR